MPISSFTSEQVDSFKTTLSYVSPFEEEDGSRKSIKLFKLSDTHISVPHEWLRSKYPVIYGMLTDKRVMGEPIHVDKLPSSFHPSVRNPEAQEAFQEEVREGLLTHGNVLACASTGSGKTVVALKTAAQLGRTTLILVSTNDLKNQWIREIKDKLGVPDSKIGIIQQDKLDYKDKYFVIGLLPTLKSRGVSDEVANAFGTVIVDECHNLSTEYLADILPEFNSMYRLGISATPHRRDGSDVVLFAHLGPIRVTSSADPLPIKIYVKNYYSTRKLWGNDERQRLICLSKDPDRNNLLVKYIKTMYESKRTILVVSNTILHVEHLIMLCKRAGINENDIGQLTAKRNTYNSQGKLTGKKKLTDEEIAIAKTKKIVFSVYAFAKEAMNIPTLDAGIDALPFWKGTQLLGRVRRPIPNKLYPKWITIRDMKCTFSSDMWNSRVREYNECQATIINL